MTRVATPGAEQSETAIVVQFRARCRIQCPGVALVAIPNGAKRTIWAAAQAKREGMATGFPDMMAVWPGGGCAFIEWKKPGGRLSLNQIEWLARLGDMGHRARVCDSADKGLEFLRGAGAPFLIARRAAA